MVFSIKEVAEANGFELKEIPVLGHGYIYDDGKVSARIVSKGFKEKIGLYDMCYLFIGGNPSIIANFHECVATFNSTRITREGVVLKEAITNPSSVYH